MAFYIIILIFSNLSCTTKEEDQNYEIKLSVYPAHAGTVTGEVIVMKGETVKINATPTTGFTFDHWQIQGSNKAFSEEADFSFKVVEDLNLIAIFRNISEELGIIDIIADYQFLGEIGLQGARSSEPNIKKYLRPFESNSIENCWMLGEWGSKYDLLNTEASIDPIAGMVSYFNKSKGIHFRKEKNENNKVVIGLEVVASQEVEKPREANDNFPGILLGQDFKGPTRISEFQQLLLTLNTRLLYVENKMKENEYREALHTAQITLYFSLGNINGSSAGYRDYLWFGIPIYDFRFRDIKISWMQDSAIEGATQKFIYVPGAKEFYEGSMHDKEWISINEVDILPYLENAFLKAQEMGYLLSSDYKDMALTSTNFGWEMPGIFDAMYEFKDLRLIGLLKKTNRK